MSCHSLLFMRVLIVNVHCRTPSTRGYCSQCFARKFPDEHKSLQEQKRAELIKAGKLPPDSAKPTSPTSGSSSNGPIPVSSVAALLSLLGLSGRVHVGDGVGSGARDRERDPLDDDGLDDGDEQIEGAVRVGVHAAAAGKGASADGAKANGAGTGNSNGDKDKGSFSAELEAEREAKRREIIERLRAQGKLKGAPPSPAPAQSPAAAAGAALDSASKPKPPDSPPVPAPAPASMSLAEAVSSAGGKIGPAPPKYTHYILPLVLTACLVLQERRVETEAQRHVPLRFWTKVQKMPRQRRHRLKLDLEVIEVEADRMLRVFGDCVVLCQWLCCVLACEAGEQFFSPCTPLRTNSPIETNEFLPA